MTQSTRTPNELDEVCPLDLCSCSLRALEEMAEVMVLIHAPMCSHCLSMHVRYIRDAQHCDRRVPASHSELMKQKAAHEEALQAMPGLKWEEG